MTTLTLAMLISIRKYYKNDNTSTAENEKFVCDKVGHKSHKRECGKDNNKRRVPSGVLQEHEKT